MDNGRFDLHLSTEGTGKGQEQLAPRALAVIESCGHHAVTAISSS
jgi:hypothetical protein